MAVVRAQSSPPYALIVFVFLTVVCAGVAVWMAVGQGDLKTKAENAQKELARVEGPRDSAFAQQLLQGAKNQTALSVAQGQITQLKGLIDGDKSKSVESVVQGATDVAQKAYGAAGRKDSSLVTAVQDLSNQWQEAQTRIDTLQKQLKGQGEQAAQ